MKQSEGAIPDSQARPAIEPAPPKPQNGGTGSRVRPQRMAHAIIHCLITAIALAFASPTQAEIVEVEGQPLASNVKRLHQALTFLGQPLNIPGLDQAVVDQDHQRIQQLLDPQTLFTVSLNPEYRVKVKRTTPRYDIQQAGYTPVLIKVVNHSDTTPRLRITSPQAGAVYAGASKFTMLRMQSTELTENQNNDRSSDRFLDLEIYSASPMSDELNGLEVEYKIGLIYASESGKREAIIGFDIGQGTQDLGFRGETPVLFDIRPAVPVKLSVADHDGQPTIGRFEFTDAAGRVYPSQAKRLAPDLFFQPHIYRSNGETVLLPPGKISMRYGRGPEYRWITRNLDIRPGMPPLAVKLERWIHPAAHGYFGGDHHIHAAGCAHYQFPTQGVGPEDIYRQVKGEGLNVGCILTWGPCFDHQSGFFSPEIDQISDPLTILKYDIEVSGFGSAAFGHVCLLNLKEQIYPGAQGSKDWPIWTVPTLEWAKQQGAVTGYAHSAGGLQIDVKNASSRLINQLDTDKDQSISRTEAANGLLPDDFRTIDRSRDGLLNLEEIQLAHERAADCLPNIAIPEMNGGGAQEIFVTVPLGTCDFISAMDTARIPEWNCWYHLLNCGFPLWVSGETDFPCMSGTRVGQGRVYAHLGPKKTLDYSEWCEAIAQGRSYVSDGYAHALDFTVGGRRSGSTLRLKRPQTVTIQAKVAFSSETPIEVEYGGRTPLIGQRLIGDTINQHPAKMEDLFVGQRTVELIVNGHPVAKRIIKADDKLHAIQFTTKIDKSSWIALRQFPQLHTNPVMVELDNQPIRASRESALWAIECTEQLWRVRERRFRQDEKPVARATYDKVIAMYRKIAREAAR